MQPPPHLIVDRILFVFIRNDSLRQSCSKYAKCTMRWPSRNGRRMLVFGGSVMKSGTAIAFLRSRSHFRKGLSRASWSVLRRPKHFLKGGGVWSHDSRTLNQPTTILYFFCSIETDDEDVDQRFHTSNSQANSRTLFTTSQH
jgi:hypothetical protein